MANKNSKLKLTKAQKIKIFEKVYKDAMWMENNSIFSSQAEVRARVFKREFIRYLFGK